MSLGIEGSGVVQERGAEVKDIEVGDAVAYMGIAVRFLGNSTEIFSKACCVCVCLLVGSHVFAYVTFDYP